MHPTEQKYQHLLEVLRSMGKMAVAFSGGVDSTFLLKAAREAPVEDIVAFTIRQPYIQPREVDEATRFTREQGIVHHVFSPPVDDNVMQNPINRCYLCKKKTFTLFKEEINKRGFDTLVDGSNADDTGEYRPGMKAIKELDVRSPLLEAGFTKDDVRYMSRVLGLPKWDKPSNTCLITRIPYDTRVTVEDLRMIDQAETFLIRLGIHNVRVRKHGDIARIEVSADSIGFITLPKNRKQIIDTFKHLGFTYISVDLEGYSTGSLDKNITDTNT